MDRSVVLLVLLVIHVGGAIVGFGPTFAFAILGPKAAAAGPNGGVAIMESILAIEEKLVKPVAWFTQPLSGLSLIFVAGFADAFLTHTWLIVAIVIYAVAIYLAFFVQAPAIEKMIHLAKAGPPTPERARLGKKTPTVGPILTVALAAVIVLMVTKPGG